MIVRPWQPGDVEKVVLQEGQEYLRAALDTTDVAPLAKEGMVWTGESEQGIMGVAGIIPYWPGRAGVWAIISPASGRHFVQIHRKVVEILDNAPFRRIEATVDVGFKPGHRWVKMLGFEPEGYLTAYRPDGGDQIMYARIKR